MSSLRSFSASSLALQYTFPSICSTRSNLGTIADAPSMYYKCTLLCWRCRQVVVEIVFCFIVCFAVHISIKLLYSVNPRYTLANVRSMHSKCTGGVYGFIWKSFSVL